MSSARIPPRMAILDDYHDIALPHFQSLTNITVDSFPTTLHPLHSKSDHAALIARLKPYTIISTMRERTPLPASVLSQLPNLRLLLTTANRNASLDARYCADHGITYAGTSIPKDLPIRPLTSVTNEHTWALILGLAKNIALDHTTIQQGGWQTNLVFGLAGKTLALLGLGRLGIQAAVTGKLGFGMDVIAWSSSLTQEKADEEATKGGLENGSIRVVESKKELFELADVVSVHYVLSERSRGMVGGEELGVMKKDALLINTSRGPLIDEKALLKVLKEGKIRGAALDVFDKEPLVLDSEWRTTDWGREGRSQVLLSPHMGYAEEKTMHGWYEQHKENVDRWVRGEGVKDRILPI